MGRLHLFEFGDMPWFPRALHRYMTDYLAFAQRLAARSLTGFVPLIERLRGASRDSVPVPVVAPIVDLCSGGAGPWVDLSRMVAQREQAGDGAGGQAQGDGAGGQAAPMVTLTDLHPNEPAMARARDQGDGRIDYEAAPVDATKVPAHLSGPRTIFNGFHHFPPAMARQVLAAAARDRRPIGVFEILARHPAALMTAPLILVMVLLTTPFIRPFRLGRLLWTYVVPVVPLVVLWDGVVSMLRVYSPAELEGLTRDIDAPGYRWDIGTVRIGAVSAPYLLGLPEDAGDAPDAPDAPR